MHDSLTVQNLNTAQVARARPNDCVRVPRSAVLVSQTVHQVKLGAEPMSDPTALGITETATWRIGS